MGIAIGIDLGTSNSVVAAGVGTSAMVLEDEEGRRTQPSVVAFGKDGSVTVGHQARKQLSYAPGMTVWSAKRLIGRRFRDPEIARLQSYVGWEIVEGQDGEARIKVGDQIISVEEVSAHILAHMKRIAERALGQTVSQAVITVPAYFNDQQRQATRDAATIAGLECLRVLNEPTAAALAYGFGKKKRQHVAIYDLGGGTFDISILRLDDDFYEVVSTAGDTFLGGDDIDGVLTQHLVEYLKTHNGVDVSGSHMALTRIRQAAEQAKILLATQEEAPIRVPRVAQDDAGHAVDLVTTLTINQLDGLSSGLLDRSFLVCDDALQQAGMALSQLDHVLLVGGMTRLPIVKQRVADYFGREPVSDINPDEVVAVGAAIQAVNLTEMDTTKTSVLLDVTPQTLGIATAGGMMEPLIPRNSPVPTEATKIFHMAKDFQTDVRVTVYQGEDRYISNNSLLGEFVLDELPPGLRGEVDIEISFTIDTDGIVHVVARDPDSGRSEEMRIEASGRLSSDQMDEAKTRYTTVQP